MIDCRFGQNDLHYRKGRKLLAYILFWCTKCAVTGKVEPLICQLLVLLQFLWPLIVRAAVNFHTIGNAQSRLWTRDYNLHCVVVVQSVCLYSEFLFLKWPDCLGAFLKIPTSNRWLINILSVFHFLADQDRINSKQGRHQPFRALMVVVFTLRWDRRWKVDIVGHSVQHAIWFVSSVTWQQRRSSEGKHLRWLFLHQPVLHWSRQFCHFESIESQMFWLSINKYQRKGIHWCKCTFNAKVQLFSTKHWNT